MKYVQPRRIINRNNTCTIVSVSKGFLNPNVKTYTSETKDPYKRTTNTLELKLFEKIFEKNNLEESVKHNFVLNDFPVKRLDIN